MTLAGEVGLEIIKNVVVHIRKRKSHWALGISYFFPALMLPLLPTLITDYD